MAHAIPKPNLFRVAQGSIIFESGVCQNFPRIGNLKTQIVITVTSNLTAQCMFQPLLLMDYFPEVIVGKISSRGGPLPILGQ